MCFKLVHQDTNTLARAGNLTTPRGVIQTPTFMPVGTAGAVKAMTPMLLKETGAQIILANTYHLYIRPGLEVIDTFGGLHRFISWDRPILTDSGGFQIFSLPESSRISDAGVEFKSHIDGKKIFLTSEDVVGIQNRFDSDIQMVLDYFAPHPAKFEEDKRAMLITSQWARRARDHFKKSRRVPGRLQFAIIQGGLIEDLRMQSMMTLVDMDFEGYAVGGLSVGETRVDFERILTFLLPQMPSGKARYLMGSGTPEDILLAVEYGTDMFDCVLPTRNARNGTLYTNQGKFSIKNQRYHMDEQPIDPDCHCYTCRNFSRAYLRHLYKRGEITASILNTIHNLYFFLDFLNKIRYAIVSDSFKEFKTNFLNKYLQGV